MLDFWRNVKEELDYNLITQKTLATSIGVSYNTLQSWITKDRLPNVEQSLKIAQKLNTSVEYLVTGKNVEKNYIKPRIQNLNKKLNQLSDDDIDLIEKIVNKLYLL
ncbi:MAG: helix-turn-helix transcriptional regulator [Treponema sp.]|nr:helix-turn-helix transcriptional regulator [Treponema sp.]MBR2106790.1 helix-turn-helix transcriptional regulator [Treponema sp.]